MPNKHPRMKLSPEEESFLRHWMYDETHYQAGLGPAKRLQLEHRVIPADLAVLIAAALPDPADQETSGLSQPPKPPTWPWSDQDFHARLAQARTTLARRHRGSLGETEVAGGRAP
jgi:hypothetical protein